MSILTACIGIEIISFSSQPEGDKKLTYETQFKLIKFQFWKVAWSLIYDFG